MISAFCLGYVVLGDTEYLGVAQKAFDWLWLEAFIKEKHQLWRRFCDGEAAIPAFLDDYAFLGQAALSLFEATGQADYLQKAVLLTRQIADRFEDPEGGFFSTEGSAADLLIRMKDDYDGAEPSGNSLAVDLFLRLGHLLGEESMAPHALRALAAASAKIKAQPTMAPQLLCALARSFAPPEQYVIRVADEGAARLPEVQALLQQQRGQFKPFLSVFSLTDEAAASLAPISPFLSNLKRVKRMTVYHCQNFTCSLPEVVE
jgi:uncharacterized protein YyaL (SSP411 family)